MENNKCIFGTFNMETGETQDGYIDKNGEMKYKRLPWYKRIFQKLPYQIECLGSTQIYSRWIWSNKKNYFDITVYRKLNPYTNKTYKIWANTENRTIFFDSGLYDKNKNLIILK